MEIRKDLPPRAPGLPRATDIPVPPFLGVRTFTARMEDVFPYLNELTLFSTQWQFVKGGADPKKYAEDIEKTAPPGARPG